MLLNLDFTLYGKKQQRAVILHLRDAWPLQGFTVMRRHRNGKGTGGWNLSRDCFWDCYWRLTGQLLANFISSSVEIVPEVFANMSSHNPINLLLLIIYLIFLTIYYIIQRKNIILQNITLHHTKKKIVHSAKKVIYKTNQRTSVKSGVTCFEYWLPNYIQHRLEKILIKAKGSSCRCQR